MVLNMRASSLKIRFKDKENIFGQIRDNIRESGLIIKCMAMEFTFGKMEDNTKANT